MTTKQWKGLSVIAKRTHFDRRIALNLLDSFKLWAEQIFGWYYFVERSVYEPEEDGHGGALRYKIYKKETGK